MGRQAPPLRLRSPGEVCLLEKLREPTHPPPTCVASPLGAGKPWGCAPAPKEAARTREPVHPHAHPGLPACDDCVVPGPVFHFRGVKTSYKYSLQQDFNCRYAEANFVFRDVLSQGPALATTEPDRPYSLATPGASASAPPGLVCAGTPSAGHQEGEEENPVVASNGSNSFLIFLKDQVGSLRSVAIAG